MDPDPKDESELLAAELLGMVAAGRPDHLVGPAMAQLPPALHPHVLALQEAYARLAFVVRPMAPPAQLRDRVLASFRARSVRSVRRAVLVIDMLNDHLAPGGPLEVPRAREIVSAIRQRLEVARREGMPVIYVVDEHDPNDPDLDTWRSHNVRGTRGGEIWPELGPEPGDRIVRKPTYSAFTRSDLGETLDAIGVDTLVLTGCLTEIGIHATAVDALQRGYAIEVPPDAQAGISAETERATLELLSVMPPYGQARADLLGRLQR